MIIVKNPDKYLNELPAIAIPDYLSIFNGLLDYGYFVENSCLLPFIIRKRYFMKFIQFTSPVLGTKNIEEEKTFLNNLLYFIKREMNIDFIDSSNTSIFKTFPDESLFCKFGSYIVNLNKSENDLFAALHSKHRNVIKKAQNDGLQVFFGKEFAQECYLLIHETFNRQNLISPSIEYIQRLEKLSDIVSFVVVKKGDTIQGCAIFLWNKGNSCYYLHGGSILKPHPGAMNLLHWETMLRMKNNGVKYYNFVGGRLNTDSGSKLEGIQRFKSRFGGDFEIGYLWKYIFNKPKYKLYNLLLKLYFKIILHQKYTGDVIDQERMRGNF